MRLALSYRPEGRMDVQDGFIVGIYNYCDRWCETCSFTSRCRVFADRAELEAQSDPQLSDVVNAPPLRRTCPRPYPSGCGSSSTR